MKPAEISTRLRKCDLIPVIQWAREWTQTASYGDITQIFRSMPLLDRDRLVLILRDVLTHYPETTHGFPVLLAISDPQNRSLLLPLPEHAPPDPTITKMAWVGLNTLREGRFGQPAQNLRIPAGGMHCAVLLTTTAGPAMPTLTDEWWSELMEVAPGACLRMSSRICAPWPDAVEAAAAMLSAAATGGTQFDTPRLFLDEASWAFALECGQDWRRALILGEEDI